MLQHPDQALAAAPGHGESDIGEHPLGTVPHQIRGFLSRFQNLVVSGKSYNCCCACSGVVLEAYAKQGWDFVKRALLERGYVEELSGLAEVSLATPYGAVKKFRLTLRGRFREQLRQHLPVWSWTRTKFGSTTMSLKVK